MPVKEKKGRKLRDSKGRVRKPEDVKPAIFSSHPEDLKLAMESAETRAENKNDWAKPGKHIEFNDGTYITKDPEEIYFLKNVKTGPISSIELVRDIQLKDEAKESG